MVRWVGFLAMVGVGCTPAVSTDGSDGTDGETDSDESFCGDTEACSDDGSYVLEGVVTDEAGQPVCGAVVFLCNKDICFTDITWPDGRYCLSYGQDDAFAFKVKTPGYATASTPLVMGDGSETRLIDVTVLDLGPEKSVVAAAQEVEVTPGVWVTMSQGQIDADAASARLVPQASILPVDEPPSSGSIVATWYLSPYDSASGASMSTRITGVSAYGLADGDRVSAWVHSYAAFTDVDLPPATWIPAGEATVENDEVAGLNLSTLATLVLVKE